MKKTSLLLTLCLILFFSVQTQAQVKDKDTMIQRIFTAVKNSDEQAYLKLFPSFTQLQALFNHMLDNMKDSSMRMVMRQQFQQLNEETYKQKMGEELKSSFRQLIQNGKEKGINWADLSYVGSHSEEENVDEIGGKQISGTIQLKDASQEYNLYFSDVIWSEPHKAWFGAMLKGITRKGDTLKSVMDEFVQVDSAIMAVDTAVVIQPPPPAKKPVNKKPVEKKPLKSGTGTSPANKPKN